MNFMILCDLMLFEATVSTCMTIYLFCGTCVTLTSFQIDAAGDGQAPFAEVAQEAAEGSVVAGQSVCMQVV